MLSMSGEVISLCIVFISIYQFLTVISENGAVQVYLTV